MSPPRSTQQSTLAADSGRGAFQFTSQHIPNVHGRNMTTQQSTAPAYKRVLLKISGESFCREGESGISMSEITSVAEQIRDVMETGVELAIVCGGGNILRGKDFAEVSDTIIPSTAHYMGMLATVINALALQDALETAGVSTRVQSAIRMEGVAEPFIRRRCIRHLEKGRVVILAAGTGSPFVTTDTAAALRAREIDADVVLKATKVNGVFSEDPVKNPHAIRYTDISYRDVLAQNLQVMDAQAFHHCMEQKLPIVIFNYKKVGNIGRVIAGDTIGTRVTADGTPNAD
jgi:uridylate kinase